MKRQIVLAAAAFASLSLAGCAGPRATATAPYQEPGSASIRDLQLRLREAGYDPGPADGAWGAGTRDALARYQADHGFPITGEPDRRTVLTLGLDPQRY